MEIIGVTVSVNYSDILAFMLRQNAKFLHKWYIVSSPEDIKTAELLRASNLENVELLIYHGFHENGAVFNKGGAVQFAQNHIENNYTGANILLLDSDIYLPDTFTDKLPACIEDNILYGVRERLDYWTVEDYVKNQNPRPYRHGDAFVGFFQLYKQNTYKYPSSYSCSDCDNLFSRMFGNHIHIEISVKHLGKEGDNWYGRRI